MSQTIKLGITGGIGSGKSVVSHLLQLLGVPVYICDAEAKRLTVSDPQIRAGLTALLGQDVYQGNVLNKKLVADYLFANSAHANQINGIIHPRVKADFEAWIQSHASCPVLGMESAILLEAGFATTVDRTIMVYAPREVRVARAMLRDKAGREAVERRVNQQMSDEQKRAQCHHVIVNDGHTPLIPQVLDLLKLITLK